jgi:hypothetical protein
LVKFWTHHLSRSQFLKPLEVGEHPLVPGGVTNITGISREHSLMKLNAIGSCVI